MTVGLGGLGGVWHLLAGCAAVLGRIAMVLVYGTLLVPAIGAWSWASGVAAGPVRVLGAALLAACVSEALDCLRQRSVIKQCGADNPYRHWDADLVLLRAVPAAIVASALLLGGDLVSMTVIGATLGAAIALLELLIRRVASSSGSGKERDPWSYDPVRGGAAARGTGAGARDVIGVGQGWDRLGLHGADDLHALTMASGDLEHRPS